MNVGSVSALWNDQTSSVVSALKNSSDPTVSMFSNLLDQMMTNDSITSQAASLGKAASSSGAATTGANSASTAIDATGSAKEASHKWVSKMADHFRQTAETGSINTLLPDVNQLNQASTGSITNY